MSSLRRVVVTGGSGHIGGRVVAMLRHREYEVTMLVRQRTPQVHELERRGARVVVCDLLQPDTYSSVFSGHDAVFHLAAVNTTDVADETSVLRGTNQIAQSVISTALAEGIKTIVYTSSVVVLGRSDKACRLRDEKDRTESAQSPYIKGKLLAEDWVARLVLQGSDIRRVYPSWVIGPGNTRLTPPHAFLLDYATKGQCFYVGGGVSVAHVDDVALGHVFALERGRLGEQYVLSGENVTFVQMYNMLAKRFGYAAPRLKIPKSLACMAAAAMGRFSPVAPAYAREVIDRYAWYDCGKARRELGYSPRRLEETIDDAVAEIRRCMIGTAWLREHNCPAIVTNHAQSRLLITGFPGWLGNRAVDILMNGDRHGRNRTKRPIRLLVQPSLVPLVPSLPANYEVFAGDITDKESVMRAVSGVDAVWHLAGVVYPKKVAEYEQVNMQGTRNIAEACIARGVTRVLYMSSDSCCGYTPPSRVFAPNEPSRPYKAYGRSKHEGERLLLQLTAEGKLRATSLRGFWFFGPNVPPRNRRFLKSFQWPFQIVFGSGKNRRSISHLDDVIDAFCRSETAEASVGKWYWLPAFLEPQSVQEIYEMISVAAGKTPRCVHVPNLMCEMLGACDTVLERVFGQVNATIHAAGKFHKTIATDAGGTEGARRDFGWEPRIKISEIQEELRSDLHRVG